MLLQERLISCCWISILVSVIIWQTTEWTNGVLSPKIVCGQYIMDLVLTHKRTLQIDNTVYKRSTATYQQMQTYPCHHQPWRKQCQTPPCRELWAVFWRDRRRHLLCPASVLSPDPRWYRLCRLMMFQLSSAQLHSNRRMLGGHRNLSFCSVK